MAVASVTLDSLKNIRRALSDFQVDIESFSDKIRSSTEQVLIEVGQSVKKQQDIVSAAESRVSSLIKQIEAIQTTIISVNAKITSLKTEIANLENQRDQLGSQIYQLEQQKRQVGAEKNNTQDESSGIEVQIRSIENQIQSIRRMLYQINEQITSARKQQADNERMGVELKDNRMRRENDLSTAKSELSRSQNKLERLLMAGNAVERDVASLNMAVHQFEQYTLPSSDASKMGVNRCITEIEEYLAINLGGFGGYDSGRVGTSSHSTILEPGGDRTSNVNARLFCGDIYVNKDPLNDSRFYVCGNHYDRYLAYWQNMGQNLYSETDTASPNDIVYVRARDIEGIYLYEGEVTDPNRFWGERTGGTQESFERISNQIPEVRNLFERGLSFHEIREARPDLSDCVGIYFEGAPTVSSLEDFYVFNSNGRHRILAAFSADEMIPVRIVSSICRRE